MRIVIANLKGGVGKTTTSVLLAEAIAEKYSKCVLIDLDPSDNGSATTWLGMAPSMRSVLKTKPPETGWVIYDTPPFGASVVNMAIGSADVVIIPARPSGIDLARLRAMVDIVLNAGKPPVVLLSQVRAGTTASKAALDAIDSAKLPVLLTQIPLREAIQNAYGTTPGSALLRYYSPLISELEEALNG